MHFRLVHPRDTTTTLLLSHRELLSSRPQQHVVYRTLCHVDGAAVIICSHSSTDLHKQPAFPYLVHLLCQHHLNLNHLSPHTQGHSFPRHLQLQQIANSCFAIWTATTVESLNLRATGPKLRVHPSDGPVQQTQNGHPAPNAFIWT
jgi:hypothetical protein